MNDLATSPHISSRSSPITEATLDLLRAHRGEFVPAAMLIDVIPTGRDLVRGSANSLRCTIGRIRAQHLANGEWIEHRCGDYALMPALPPAAARKPLPNRFHPRVRPRFGR